MAAEDDVRRIALALPDVTEDQDTLGFAVRGKGFAWSWKERVVPKKARVERRDVLAVRLADVDPDELAELLTGAWRARAPRALVSAYDAQRP
jgi:hypothetical protein